MDRGGRIRGIKDRIRAPAADRSECAHKHSFIAIGCETGCGLVFRMGSDRGTSLRASLQTRLIEVEHRCFCSGWRGRAIADDRRVQSWVLPAIGTQVAHRGGIGFTKTRRFATCACIVDGSFHLSKHGPETFYSFLLLLFHGCTASC